MTKVLFTVVLSLLGQYVGTTHGRGLETNNYLYCESRLVATQGHKLYWSKQSVIGCIYNSAERYQMWIPITSP